MKRTVIHTSRYVHIASAVILALLTVGCSDTDGPQNIEPVITLLDATDVTRTEATLRAVVKNPGTGSLSYMHFLYGPEGGELQSTDNTANPIDTISMRITGLKPGACYTFHAEGGVKSAVVTTGSLSFSTYPNDPPSLSAARTISSGPVGAIVEFEITDDGGEQLMQAGCILTQNSTGDTRRILIPDSQLSAGRCRVNITGLLPLTEYSITSFAESVIGEALGEPLIFTTGEAITLTEGGNLSAIFDGNTVNLSSIAIGGPMNGDDFHFLRCSLGAPKAAGEEAYTSVLREVDLSDVTIVEGGGTYDGSRFCLNDIITTGLFADCVNLQHVTLPTTVVTIESEAFARCPRLESLTIPASVKSLLPSTECPALKSIDVSVANDSYASHEGVLFNVDKTEILWFPQGKNDSFTLPSTLNKIGVNAFKGTAITGLVIPESVTTIERGAFVGSVLESITLPDAITTISTSMFQNCSHLRSVILGKNVDYVSNYVFDGCPLEHIYLKAINPPYTTKDALTSGSYDLLTNCTLHVPASARAVYRNHASWGKFLKIVADE